MRIAVYVRVSTGHQTQTQTIEQQLEQLRVHIAAQDWQLLDEDIFRDDGFSGSTLNRPGLDRLRDRAATGGLDLVLLTAPDRLARKYVHQVLLIEELQQHNCQVEFLEHPMSQDPHDQLLLQIRGAVAEYERTLITERMRRGRLSKYRAGVLLPWTRPPYGLRMHPDRPRDPSGVRVEEAEGAVVKEIYAEYLQDGASLMRVARWLYECGIPSPNGKKRWGLASIRGVLTNPAYTGQVFAGRMNYRPAKVRRSATHPIGHPHASATPKPQDEWIFVATIPALVTQEQFDLVQAKLAQNKRLAWRNNKAHQYLLRALVSCGVCQLSCCARSSPEGKNSYYVCSGKGSAARYRHEEKCPSRFIPAQKLDEIVWQDLCEILLHPEIITQALGRAQGGHWLPQELQARCENLRRAHLQLDQQLKRLTDAYLGGIIPLAEYKRRRAELEQRISSLDTQANSLGVQADRQKELAGLADSIGDFCERVQQGLANATFEQRRQLVELLIDRVIVTNGEVEIRYVIPTSPSSEHIRFCQLRSDYFCHPEFIGAVGREVTLDQIGCRTCSRPSLGGAWPLATADAPQMGCFHQARHPLAAHMQAFFRQFGVNARRSIGAFRFLVDLPDLLGQHSVFLFSLGRRSLQPGIEPAGRDFQDSAHAPDRIGSLVVAHELEDLGGIESVSRANQAAAFANISRSSFSCLFSLRRRASSALSSLVSPSCRFPWSSSSCLIQLRMHCAEGSNSLARSSALRPARASPRICWRYSSG
jgi:site-specific DNA recombinase